MMAAIVFGKIIGERLGIVVQRVDAKKEALQGVFFDSYVGR